MPAQSLKGKREHQRFSLMGTLPGRFFIAQKELAVMPVDVSQVGLGLLMDPSPSPGTNVTWQIPQGTAIKLKVIWSMAGETSSALHEFSQLRRCGLVVAGEGPDLLQFCRCLDGLQITE